jgi:hypothetical protein
MRRDRQGLACATEVREQLLATAANNYSTKGGLRRIGVRHPGRIPHARGPCQYHCRQVGTLHLSTIPTRHLPSHSTAGRNLSACKKEWADHREHYRGATRARELLVPIGPDIGPREHFLYQHHPHRVGWGYRQRSRDALEDVLQRLSLRTRVCMRA